MEMKMSICHKCKKPKPEKEVLRMIPRGIERNLVAYWRQCDECRAHVMKRRDDGRVPKTLREKVFVKWGKTCLACKRRPATVIDHVKPTFLGGKATMANLQILCVTCNSIKNNKTIDYRGVPCRKL
jgi:5-methylcytosine-specific restriction endonuclease McrA